MSPQTKQEKLSNQYNWLLFPIDFHLIASIPMFPYTNWHITKIYSVTQELAEQLTPYSPPKV